MPEPQTTTAQDPTQGPTGKDAGTGTSRGIVPVLAFAGIVVAVMQTLLVPVIKDLPELLNTSPATPPGS